MFTECFVPFHMFIRPDGLALSTFQSLLTFTPPLQDLNTWPLKFMCARALIVP